MTIGWRMSRRQDGRRAGRQDALQPMWLAAAVTLVAASAHAQSSPPAQSPAAGATQPAAPEARQSGPGGETGVKPQEQAATGLWDRANLLGDLGGLRSRLADGGISFGLLETSEAIGNASGGERRGVVYEGLTEFSMGVDTGKLFGLEGGTFNVSGFQIHGRGLSLNDLDNNLDTVSSIEALRGTLLFELWYEQAFLDRTLAVRVGQLAADQEFMISQYAQPVHQPHLRLVHLPQHRPPVGRPRLPAGDPRRARPCGAARRPRLPARRLQRRPGRTRAGLPAEPRPLRHRVPHRRRRVRDRRGAIRHQSGRQGRRPARHLQARRLLRFRAFRQPGRQRAAVPGQLGRLRRRGPARVPRGRHQGPGRRRVRARDGRPRRPQPRERLCRCRSGPTRACSRGARRTRRASRSRSPASATPPPPSTPTKGRCPRPRRSGGTRRCSNSPTRRNWHRGGRCNRPPSTCSTSTAACRTHATRPGGWATRRCSACAPTSRF